MDEYVATLARPEVLREPVTSDSFGVVEKPLSAWERITSIGYGSTTGAPGALNALASVAGVQSAEDAAEAAARQAAADLIAQQSRLSACLLDPANCK